MKLDTQPFVAPNVPPKRIVGLRVFMEFHKRIPSKEIGKMPASIKDDAFSMAGYCLDAPDEIPAGSCFADELNPEDFDGLGVAFLPMQRTVLRA